MTSPIILAIDTLDLQAARGFATHADFIKLGLEFYLAHGAAGVREVAGGKKIFLDLKLHDIPNTVAGAVRAIAPLQPTLLTVHAAGGPSMIRAARAEAGAAKILAVTVLTSLDAATLAATGVAGGPVQQVLRLGRLAVEAGADGLVCSPLEVSPLRAALGPDILLVTPGIRPAGAASDDQSRTMTPRAALAAGANHLVIGRPITQSPDPAAAMAAILAALA